MMHSSSPEWGEIRAQVEDMLGAGMRQRDVVAALPVTKQFVSKVAKAVGRSGEYHSAAAKMRRGTFPGVSARLSAVLLGLPDGAVNWLVAETPEGSELEEMVRAVILDAYHEARDAA